MKQCHNHKNKLVYIAYYLKWRVTLESELQEG